MLRFIILILSGISVRCGMVFLRKLIENSVNFVFCHHTRILDLKEKKCI